MVCFFSLLSRVSCLTVHWGAVFSDHFRTERMPQQWSGEEEKERAKAKNPRRAAANIEKARCETWRKENSCSNMYISHFIGYLTTQLICHRLTSILMWFAAVLMTHLFSQNASGDIVYLFANNGWLVRPVFSSFLYYFFVWFFLEISQSSSNSNRFQLTKINYLAAAVASFDSQDFQNSFAEQKGWFSSAASVFWCFVFIKTTFFCIY